MDIGYNGSEINTLNLDKLASNGALLNQFYVKTACSLTPLPVLETDYVKH